jgi:hypothetical protein
MATYVLVHGGAHGGWCYGPVARILRAAGQDGHRAGWSTASSSCCSREPSHCPTTA